MLSWMAEKQLGDEHPYSRPLYSVRRLLILVGPGKGLFLNVKFRFARETKDDVPKRLTSSVCDKGNDIAVEISHLKISSAPGLFCELLRKLDVSRLELLK